MRKPIFSGKGINLKTGKPIRFKIPDTLSSKAIESIRKNVKITELSYNYFIEGPLFYSCKSGFGGYGFTSRVIIRGDHLLEEDVLHHMPSEDLDLLADILNLNLKTGHYPGAFVEYVRGTKLSDYDHITSGFVAIKDSKTGKYRKFDPEKNPEDRLLLEKLGLDREDDYAHFWKK